MTCYAYFYYSVSYTITCISFEFQGINYVKFQRNYSWGAAKKKHIATATREFPSVEITQREYSPCFSIMLRDRLGTRSCTFSSATESAQRAKLFSASIQQTSSRRRPRVRESEEIRVRISFYRMSRQNSRCQPLNTFENVPLFPPRIILRPPRRAWFAMAGWRCTRVTSLSDWMKKSSLFHLYVYSEGVLRYSNEKFRPFFISLDTSDDDDDDDCKASVNRGSRSARLFSSFSTSSRERTIVRVCGFWLAYFFA